MKQYDWIFQNLDTVLFLSMSFASLVVLIRVVKEHLLK